MTTDRELRDRCDAERRANLLAKLKLNGWGMTATARALGVRVAYVQWMIEHYKITEYAENARPAGNPNLRRKP